jgi:hypothetical protein
MLEPIIDEHWTRLLKAGNLFLIAETLHRIEDAIYNDPPANPDELKRLLIDVKSLIDKFLE